MGTLTKFTKHICRRTLVIVVACIFCILIFLSNNCSLNNTVTPVVGRVLYLDTLTNPLPVLLPKNGTETEVLEVDSQTVATETDEIQDTVAMFNISELFNHESTLLQDDSRLLEYIRLHHLKPPPKNRNTDRIYDPSEWIPQLHQIFRGKRNGFYVECGANDGEFLSNTYFMDKSWNWAGLLIEANKFILPDLYSKGRNAWISDTCLSIKPYPRKVKYIHRIGKHEWYKGNGKILPGSDPDHPAPKDHTPNEYVDAGEVECFPLYSLLAAMNVTTVDYLSLDVEGVEYKILKNIPYDKLTIKVISVEFDIIDEGKDALLKLFEEKGYELMTETYREIFMVLTKYKHEFGEDARQRFEIS